MLSVWLLQIILNSKMRHIFFVFLFLLVTTFNLQASRAVATPSAAEHPMYSQIYDASRNPNTDGSAALKLAKETNRKVLIEVGGNWCSWCFALDRFIKDHPEVESWLHQTFVVLKVNISDENDNAEFLAAFPTANGYPHMYVTDSDGNILYSQDTNNFRENKQYSVARFMAFFDRWQ